MKLFEQLHVCLRVGTRLKLLKKQKIINNYIVVQNGSVLRKILFYTSKPRDIDNYFYNSFYIATDL